VTPLWPWIAPALLVIGAIAIARGVFAAEVEPPSPRTHQLTVCRPGEDCQARGRPMGATACSLDAASERLLAGLPSGTLITCVQVKR
jgi:hypothetical protein